MKIYKYQLPAERGSHKLVAFPIEQIMHTEVINDQAYFWALVNDSRTERDHLVHAIHTGEEDHYYTVLGTEFLGTFVFGNGAYVLHYYFDER